jgi:hypothetical protein
VILFRSFLPSSLPGIAVRRTASLRSAYDPAIHAASPLAQLVGFDSLRVGMDHRVKPGGDGGCCRQPHRAFPPPRGRINAANLDG